MSYTESAACHLVATSCCCCGRPLLDAVSVELGIGPDCRKNHGFKAADGTVNWNDAVMHLFGSALADCLVPDDARATCNKVVYRIATGTLDDVAYGHAVAALYAVGFRKLAMACAPEKRTITVEPANGALRVKAPFNPEFNQNLTGPARGQWNKAEKARYVPIAAKGGLWAAIKRSFPAGTLVFGAERVAILGA